MSNEFNINKDVLITTPLKETWPEKHKSILLLGLWCETKESLKFLSSKDYEIHEYHQSDPSELPLKYNYLKELYERTLLKVAQELNNYHKTEYSTRYWRIIIGPWLLTFIPIIWDRWESLETAFNKFCFNETIILEMNGRSMIPYDFRTFNGIYFDDYWNHFIFSEIINYKYKDKINIKEKSFLEKYNLNKPTKLTPSFKRKVINSLDYIFSILQTRYKVLLIDSYFNLDTLFRISLSLRQLPRAFHEFIDPLHSTSPISDDRFDVKLDLDARNEFEEFLQRIIFPQIPLGYLEGFNNLRSSAKKIKSRGEIIFTANAHLSNDLFNCFAANHIERGGKLIVSQHGGALKSHYGNIFNHQEDISDSMAVWHKPFLREHKKMSPSKLIGFKSKLNNKNDFLSMVAFETSNYPYRIQAAPTGSNFMKDYDHKIEFTKHLSSEVYSHLLIQARSEGRGRTNSRDMYSNDLGLDKISPYSSAKELYGSSKVIVCTYPMTTFSEAMHLDIPTILLYIQEYWPAHSQFDDLIQNLKNNNIIFTDPKSAANHINNIWNMTDEWWFSNETLLAKQEFYEMCGKVSEDPIKEWVDFFNTKL